MGNEPPFSGANGPQEGSNYDEIFMQHSLQFSDSLKDLKNLRKQLYSAAEYFESSYGENEHKTLVIETLKDYVSKALVSSVDHLGSVACKLNSFLDEKVDEFSTTKLRFSCMEQKVQTCQTIVDRSGLLQQSLTVPTPKHHKRYVNSAAETQPAVPKPRKGNKEHDLCPQHDLQLPKHGKSILRFHGQMLLQILSTSHLQGLHPTTKLGKDQFHHLNLVSSVLDLSIDQFLLSFVLDLL